MTGKIPLSREVILLLDLAPVVIGRHQRPGLAGLEPVAVQVFDRRLDHPGDRPLDEGVLLELGDVTVTSYFPNG